MTFWKNRNVFITGATGLLGSWLVEALLSKGANVTCLVRDWVPQSKLITGKILNRTNILRGELEDYPVLLRALNEYEIDTVFHLGAQTIVGTSTRSVLSTFEANIKGTWNLLEACRACSKLIERVIVASSDKAYGSHEQLPYREETPLQGRYPYDVSKSCADLISLSYFHTYRIPLAILRCGNLFGGGDINFNRLIPGTIQSALRDERPVIRSDGKYVRDYLYVLDAVDAYIQIAENLPNDQFMGEAFNISPEKPMSVLEIVHRILELLEKSNLAPIILNEASFEIVAQYLDCSKAKELLGWSPKYSFDEAMKETIAWYRHFLQ